MNPLLDCDPQLTFYAGRVIDIGEDSQGNRVLHTIEQGLEDPTADLVFLVLAQSFTLKKRLTWRGEQFEVAYLGWTDAYADLYPGQDCLSIALRE